jgi:hypothetical protein
VQSWISGGNGATLAGVFHQEFGRLGTTSRIQAKPSKRCGVTLFFRSQMQLWLAKALTSSTILAIES